MSNHCCQRDVDRFLCEGAEPLECLINKGLTYNKFPGMSVGIFSCGSVSYLQNFGVRNMNGDPITPNTVFQSGALAMTFLGAWIAYLQTLDLPLPTQDKLFPQGFNTRPSKFGSVREAGPYSAYQRTVGNDLAHETAINTMNPEIEPVSNDLFLPHNYDTGIYEPFEETNPVWYPPWQYQFTNQIEVLNYVLPHFTAEKIAEHIGSSAPVELTNFLVNVLQLPPTEAVYGKAAFQAIANKAEPMVIETNNDWVSKYVYDGDLLLASLGISLSMNAALQFLALYYNLGKINGTQTIDCSILAETAMQRTSMVVNSFTGQWNSAIGWKHVTSVNCCNRVLTMMTYLQSGGRALIAFWPKRKMGIAVLSNSMNAYPEAIASYIINYFTTFDTDAAMDEFDKVLAECEHYIKAKTPLNTLFDRPTSRDIDIIGVWISQVGFIKIYQDGTNLKAEYRTRTTMYGPSIVGSLGFNSYFFNYTDLAGIPRLMTMVFSFDGKFQPLLMNAYNYGGIIPFQRINDSSTPCSSWTTP